MIFVGSMQEDKIAELAYRYGVCSQYIRKPSCV